MHDNLIKQLKGCRVKLLALKGLWTLVSYKCNCIYWLHWNKL